MTLNQIRRRRGAWRHARDVRAPEVPSRRRHDPIRAGSLPATSNARRNRFENRDDRG
jgi:hypothetical protein